jgi:tetratricopeptide (TPR) repeat protein
VKPAQAKHKWTFKARFRSRALGWSASNLACHRLKEAVDEIKKLAKSDPVQAAEGAVFLMEKIWPALEQVDSSSGSLGSTVYWALTELLPIVIDAQADRKTRDRWLDRLYEAIQEDGVDYLDRLKDDWGPLCGSVETASHWADQFLPLLKTVWSDPRPGSYLRETAMCLSCLLAAGRYAELFEVLALHRRQDWDDRKFGVRALLAEGKTEEALAYADGSRGLNQPDAAIDNACEEILLDAGRDAEAYEKYGLMADQSSSGLATFRRTAKRYPAIEPRRILLDLAESYGDHGRWFAAAKDAGMLDLALHFAQTGSTDPKTLSRAARDLIETDARFCLHVGRIALQRMADGYGYDLTGLDVMDAYTHFIKAAEKLGVAEDARKDVFSMAANAQKGSIFANALRVAMS